MKIETVVVGEFQVNCFVVSGGTDGRALVIDPGDHADRIGQALDAASLSVAAYLLTHGHMDHVSALAALCVDRPADVALHPADAQWAFTETNAMPPFYAAPHPPPDGVTRELADGQEWTDAGLTYRVIATPGHTPGGVSFYFPEAQALFCGDTLFAGSVGRTDLPGGDPRTLSTSLRSLADLPDETRILAGHGPQTTIGDEKRTNYFMQRL